MVPEPAPAGGREPPAGSRTVGLVLGAGGIAGWAWLVGSLAGLEEVAGWDARRANLIVGTSAGAGVAAMLRGGRSAVEQMDRYRYDEHGRGPAVSNGREVGGHRGLGGPGAAPAAAPGAATASRGGPADVPGSSPAASNLPAPGAPGAPPADAPGAPSADAPGGPLGRSGSPPAAAGTGSAGDAPGSAPAVPPLGERLASGTRPDQVPRPSGPAGGASGPAARSRAAALAGRAWPAAPQLALLAFTRWPPRPGLALAGLLPRGRHTLDDLGHRLAALHGPTWPTDPLWITAVRADNGRRVVFGRDAGEGVDVATAVRASAAVPGWYEPVRVGDHVHLDGGSWSATNADLVAGLGFDVTLVLAPMSVATARLGRSKDRLRRAYHRSVLSREVDVVHRNGTDAVVLEPQPDDLSLLDGAERLDGARRLAIAERARQRVVERLAEDPSLAAAVRSDPEAEPQPEATT